MSTSGFSTQVRGIVWRRADGLCERCSECPWTVQFHHRLPRKSGGTQRDFVNRAANCLLLCAPCHSLVEYRRTESYTNGWLVHDYPTTTPATTPVRRRGLLVLLGDDGSVTPLPPTGAWGETPGLGEGLDDVWPLGEYPEVVL